MRKQNEITYNDVANYFLATANEVGEPMTNLKLQKLVYYAQAWHLANYGKALFDEEFEAWVHGPVIPELYFHFKEKGSSPIETDLKLKEVEKKFTLEQRAFLKEVSAVYMPRGAYQLEVMTHQESPWVDAREGFDSDEKCNVIINKESMRKYYAQRIRNKTN